jgi:hypothetical protein
MVIFELLIKLIVLGIILAFGSIFGLLVGFFGELILGPIGYWIGFFTGLLIFLIKCGPLLGFGDIENINTNQRKTSIFSFLTGLWLGSKFFSDD